VVLVVVVDQEKAVQDLADQELLDKEIMAEMHLLQDQALFVVGVAALVLLDQMLIFLETEEMVQHLLFLDHL
jgi:hypothetical protein